FELANNHMGNVDHGLRIIREFAAVAEPFRPAFRFAFKLQYRHLDTFIHPDYRESTEFKYIKRFASTRLSESQFRVLKAEMDRLGFITMCTPFDERSEERRVGKSVDLGGRRSIKKKNRKNKEEGRTK